MPAQVPGTALGALIRNGSFPGIFDPYLDDNLGKLPDISDVGPWFYTFFFRKSFELNESFSCQDSSRATITLHGVNYRAAVYIDGEGPVSPLEKEPVAGMFHRFSFSLNATSGTHGIAVLVEPPDNPGRPIVGQGGDHTIAMNGPIGQFFAGWDWIRATPDRNTGLWDSVSVACTGEVLLRDPAVITVSIDRSKNMAEIDVIVDAWNIGSTAVTGVVSFELSTHLGGVVLNHTVEVSRAPGERSAATMSRLVVEDAKLWWPHTHGQPYLYTASFTFTLGGHVSDSLRVNVGIRTITLSANATLGGPFVSVNGERLFVQGGNWIATDQLLRYTASEERYDAEVRMHRHMGMNLIRVWGGGLTERSLFYEACDRYGLLVMQEFWMSGDNNGRWAGEFSWPLDHGLYLRCAKDAVLMLRRHPSLALWCGGNELYPKGKCPPADIANGLQSLVSTLDPSRAFILSSMSNYTDFDTEYALAPKDGPYNILDIREYSQRNPGLHFWNHSRADNLLLAFNPEVGHMNMPWMESMTRFLSRTVIDNFPGFQCTNYDSTWEFHKYLGYCDTNGLDHVYMYGAPSNTTEFVWRTQLVQYQSSKLLFEAFQAYMWTRYTAMLYWKSQSPWPSMRGFLYDYYLAQNGGFWGVRSALHSPLHVQLDVGSLRVVLVNKRMENIPGPLTTVCIMYALDGALVSSQSLTFPSGIAESSAIHSKNTLSWPVPLGEVLIVRLSLKSEGSDLASNHYLLSDPLKTQDYMSLGALREEGPHAVLSSTASSRSKFNVSIVITNNGPGIAIAVHAVLLHPYDVKPNRDERVLPAWGSDGLFSLLPSESTTLLFQWGAAAPPDGKNLRFRVEGWNVLPHVVVVT